MKRKQITKTKRFEMRMTAEDHQKLEKLWKHYNDKSAADFLMKFIRNEYHFTFDQEKEHEKYLCIDEMLDALDFVKQAGWDYFKLEKDEFGFYIIACGKDKNNVIHEIRIAHISDNAEKEFIPKYYTYLYPQELFDKPEGYFPLMEY